MVALVAFLGTLGAVATAVVTWLIARRKSSGSIHTSEADQLWAESASMRSDLRQETIALRAEVVSLRDEAVKMRDEMIVLRQEAVVMRREQEELRQHAHDCDAEVARLRARLESLEHG